MTLIVAHRRVDRIDIISDGALYDDAGVIHGAQCKVVAMPRVPAVVAGSGKCRIVDAVTDALRSIFAQVDTFDRALLEIAAGLRLLKRLKRAPPFRIVVAGISETDGPSVYRFGNTFEEGVVPFVLHKTRHGVAMQHDMPDALHREFLSAGGLRGCAIDFMENMRRDGLADGSLVVGCHVDFTTVTASGVKTECIHEWADTIGERISPNAGGGNVRLMNRAERRAAKSKRRAA